MRSEDEKQQESRKENSRTASSQLDGIKFRHLNTRFPRVFSRYGFSIKSSLNLLTVTFRVQS